MRIHICLLWLFCAQDCLGQDWIAFESHETNIRDVYADDQTTKIDDTSFIRHLRSVPTEADEVAQSDSTETEIVLDEDGNPRDKRAFGFIIRGLANALGYTISPLQVASLPNPSPPPPPPPPPSPPAAPPAAPPKAPAPAAPPKAPAPAAPRKPPPPAAPPAKSPAPPPQPRQRETIRITGLVNFGPNANANLPAQLGQYEQLFHGNAAGAAPQPPPASAPAPAPAKPAAGGPMLKMSLPRIPNPIVPNLSPLLPPSRPPVSVPGSTPTKSKKQEVETEYRNSENFDKLNVEDKEINGDGNIYTELPAGAYLQGSDWRQGYAERLKELEERQKEYADRLAKHEALLVKQQQDYEDTNERFANREKEIAERDKTHTARLRERERERASQKEEEGSKPHSENLKTEYENEDKSSEGYKRPQSSEGEEEEHPDKQEIEEERPRKQYSDHEEEPKKYQDYEDYPQRYSSYLNDDDQPLPISRDKETPKSENLRNSYGESLEDEGEIDENIAEYFAKFKDPNTGLYMPEKTQNPENYSKEKEPWWKKSREDHDARLEHLRREYASPGPESKYEEYELEETPAENEDNKSARKLELNNEQEERSPQANKAQKIPDYSGAFGGNEPYVQRSEQEHDQEIVPPSTDNAESPRSALEQSSDDESAKENEKSTEEKDLPFYHFDFKGFAPYYSPIKYIYDSDEAEPGIPRIKSYNQNTEVSDSEEPTKEDSPVERNESNEDRHPKIGLPEKLAIKNLHDDGESKELHAWPAPFDYVFDSTEQTNVVELPRLEEATGTEDADEGTAETPYRSEGLEATPKTQLAPDYDNFFRNQHDHHNQQQQSEPESYHGYSSRTKNLQELPTQYGFQGYSRPLNSLADSARQFPAPYVPREKYHSQGTNTKVNHDEISDLLSPKTQNHRYSGNESPLVNQRRGHKSNRIPDRGDSRNIQTSSSPHTEERNRHESQPQYRPVESQANKHIINDGVPISLNGPHRQFGPGNADLRNAYRPIESHSHKHIKNDGVPISQNGPGRQFGPGNADLRNRGYDFGAQYTPAKPRLTGRRFDESANHQLETQDPSHYPQPEDKSSLKFDDPKSAHDFFGFSQNDYDYENNKKIEKSEHIANTPSIPDHNEASDLPVISDPAPYQYDEKLTEFTDEPESDTEKVKVKEYRNKQATVTISETKQLSPEGPIHLIGYKHQY